MQSNFGIVTRMGKWLSPRPEVYVPVEVRAAQESDLEALIDTMRPLLLDGTVSNVPLLGTLTGAASMTKPRAQWHAGRGPAASGVLQRARAELGLGFWNLRMALYGAEAVVDAQLAQVKKAFAGGVPGAEVAARKIPGDQVSEQTVFTHPERVQAGIPGLVLLDSLQWWGGIGGHLDFSPVAPLIGAHVRRLVTMSARRSSARALTSGPAPS